jgi:hypothetical protein
VDACGCGGPEEGFGVHVAFDWAAEWARVSIGMPALPETRPLQLDSWIEGRRPTPDPPVPRRVSAAG